MARRLNKKVAIIGSLFLTVLLLVGIFVVLKLTGGDPVATIEDAKVAFVKAEALAKDYSAKGDLSDDAKDAVKMAYDLVERNYKNAFGYAKKDKEMQIEILFTLADFYHIENEFCVPNWNKIVGCWRQIISIDTSNVDAMLKVFDFYNTMQTSIVEIFPAGDLRTWSEIEEQAGDIIEVMEEKDIAVPAYILKAKAWAAFEISDSDENPEDYLADAIKQFEHLVAVAPEDAEAYSLLGRAYIRQGQMQETKGISDAMEIAKAKRDETLQLAIEKSEDKDVAKVNWLNVRFISSIGDKDATEAVKSEYVSLAEQYPSSAKVHAGLSRFLSITDRQDFDNIIREILKAIDLDPENPGYHFSAATIYHNKAMILNDTNFLDESIKVAENALDLPGVRDVEGPKQQAARAYRVNLHKLLAKCHIEKVMFARADGDDKQKELSILNAEKSVHEINQFKEDRDFVEKKWAGLLAMAKGQDSLAISNLYYAQELRKATEDIDPVVSYSLSMLLNGRSEIGARVEFLTDALLNKFKKSNYASIANTKPQSLLEYAELLLKLRQHATARDVATVFEEQYGSNDRSSSVFVMCDIQAQSFDDADKRISKMDPQSSQTQSLLLNLVNARITYLNSQLSAVDPTDENYNAGNIESAKQEVEDFQQQRVSIIKKLLVLESGDVPFARLACSDFLQRGEIAKAKDLAEAFIAASENNDDAKIFRLLLDEPEPLKVPMERQNEIRLKVYSNTKDQLQRHIKLGQLYTLIQEKEKSLSEYKAALEISPDDKDALGGVFDAALIMNDVETARKILPAIRKNDLDECKGEFFTARVEITEKAYESAMKRLDDCLVIRPVYPYAYILKSQIATDKGQFQEAVDNAKKAASMNSLDGVVAKQVAIAIDARNKDLGSKLTKDHRDEMKNALMRAMALNRNEWQLQKMYAEYIGKSEPKGAVSVLQNLVKRVPSVENYLALGQMAQKMGLREVNKSTKQFFFDIAGPAFETAYKTAPENDTVVASYCEFMRVTDKREAALKILENHKKLLSQFQLRDGQFEKAKTILLKLYETSPKDLEVIRGLMLASQQTMDKEGLKKYSQELLEVEKNDDNELLQIQMFLDAGLISEASEKLESFRTRNPEERRGLLLEAWSTMSDGKPKAALKLVDQYLVIDPENPMAWRLRGQVQSLNGDYAKAIQDMRKSKALSDTPAIQIELANVYHRSGDTIKAIGVLTEALKDDRAPLRMRIMLEQLYFQSGRKSKLLNFYKGTLEKYPDSINWHFRAGRFSLTEGRFLDAQKYFLRAWNLGKDTDRNHAALNGYLAAIRGDRKYLKAIAYAKNYTDGVYAQVAYLNMANAEQRLGNRKESLEYYFKAIEKSGDNSSFALQILGNMSTVLGVGEVVKWCESELAADDKSFTANRMMSTVKVQMKEFDEAVVYIDKCIAGFDPDSEKHLDLLADKANISLQAYMASSDGKYLDLSIDIFEDIIIRRPNNAGIKNNLAYLLAKNGRDIKKALEYGESAHKMSPNDANIMDTYAFVLCKSGDYTKARELIRSAIGIYEKDNTVIYWDVINHLGMANEGLNEIEAAKENYNEALRLAGDKISPAEKDELMAAVDRISKKLSNQ